MDRTVFHRQEQKRGPEKLNVTEKICLVSIEHFCSGLVSYEVAISYFIGKKIEKEIQYLVFSVANLS